MPLCASTEINIMTYFPHSENTRKIAKMQKTKWGFKTDSNVPNHHKQKKKNIPKMTLDFKQRESPYC